MKQPGSLIMIGVMLVAQIIAQDSPTDPARDREMRQRYESVLLKNPFQERAFNSVYESYSKIEGVDKWVEALKPKSESGEDALSALLLLGQIYDRQFKTSEAVAALEQAAAKGEASPQFKVLLGTLYYKAGRDEQAARLLSEALDALTDLDQRSAVSRLLGNLYLRQGRRDQAVAVWKRIAEQNPGEVFAQLELAELYEDNRMWDQAIEVYRGVVARSGDDPYRKCRALRSIGQCQVLAERFKDAIATYEQALELVSPGNWLFEDLKLRLVAVYEDIGDLAGLVNYLQARLQQNANDTEFRDLLAETLTRMAKFDDAEQQYRQVLERDPRNSSTYEKLIALHTRTGKKADVTANFEKLIELFPTDPEYLRRLGEFQLRDGQPDKAKEIWRRIVRDNPSAEKLATLAGWFESYDFADEAIATYGQALAKKADKEWTGRLATLRFQKGEEVEAVKLWLSTITEQSKPEDFAEIASVLEANNKTDEALKLRKQAVEKSPDSFEGRLAYAKLLVKKQQFEPALEQFEILASQDQNEFLQQQGEQGRIDVWRELGVLEEKQKALEAEVTRNPADAKKLGQLARLFERAGQREKAIALYEGRREKEPDNIEHLRSLAKLYAASKQTEQAIATYTALLEKDKNRARVYQKELLDIYLAVDLKNEAIGAGETYVSLAPGDPEAHLTLAQVYQMYRLPDKAFNEYRTALRLEPKEPDYQRQYGEALEQEKRYGEAQEAFRNMLDVAREDSTRLSAVANLARIHLEQDRLAELTAEFQRRIRNTPKKLGAYEELAAIYKESGQIFKSVEVLESGLQNVDDKSAALKSLIRTAFEAQDFAKVKSFYEQLVAMSGKPTANEFEKLGQIYSQLGDVEKAKSSWNSMLAIAPKDPKAHDRVANLLRDEGFTDEALGVKARAVELDPLDYKRRFEYAQLLAQSQQPVQAMDQLRLLLETGDREERKDEKEAEKKVQQVRKGQQSGVNPYQFLYGGGRYYGRGWGGGWQGSFKQFRPQVLQFMASLAQQSIGEDAFVEQYQERVKKAGDNLEVKRDLLTVLQLFNRMDEALKLAQQILVATPNDPELLQTISLLYSNQGQIDQAIPLLERLAQSQPKQRLTAAQGLVPLYFKNKQEDKALALIDDLLKENATDMQTYYAMSAMLQQNAKWDEAKRVLSKLREVDPTQAGNVRNTLAQISKQAGKLDESLALYREALFSDSGNRPAYFTRSRRVDIYTPDMTQNPGRSFGNPMQNLPVNALGDINWEKSAAFGELSIAAKAGTDKGTNVLEVMEQTAHGWAQSATPSQRDQAWEIARLLIGHYLMEKEFEKSAALLTGLRQAGFDEVGWYNASIYAAQQQEDWNGMVKLYEQLQQRYPAKARDITIARANTYLLAKKYDDVAKVVHDLSQQRVPPGQILGLISVLQNAGEKKLARQLLEEHLAGVSRNPQALSMLAALCGEENDFDQAIALANEAWERKAHGTQGGVRFYGGYYSYYNYNPQFGQVDNLLNDLYRYYVGAGKSDELIGRFKETLDKQPGSVQAHENLASLYRLGNQRDQALEIYQRLVEKRPHLLQVRRSIAGLYQEMGQFDKATALYEDLIKSNPSAYQSLQWELRWAYQRQGKGKELAKMEDAIAAKARDPNQLTQLAYRMREEGEIEKAIELFRKAVKMAPGQGHLQGQLASAFLENGQLDEALKAYEEWFGSPQLRAQGWTDHYTLRQFAGLYKATGKLDDLKARCDADLKKNSADRVARALQAHIAFLEKRFPDALVAFKAMLESGTDPNVTSQLVELAGFGGQFKEVLAVAERADASGNSWDSQQLASLYYAAGDKKKAADQQIKWAEQMIQQGNGSWAIRETMEQLSRMDLWAAVEQFVTKHRSDNIDQWEADEFDRNLAQRYVANNRFDSVVKGVLAKESLKGRDLSLVNKIVEAYRSRNELAKSRVFLEKLVAADASNRELAFQLVQLYDRPEDLPKKLTLVRSLVEADPNNVQYRTVLAGTLIALGRADEALNSLAAWATGKPSEQRWVLLSQMQANAGRLPEARESLVKAAATADKTRQTDVKIQLAEFDAQHGDSATEREALSACFLSRKDAYSFQRLFRFLDDGGWAGEAHTLFVTNKDNGYLDQYQDNNFATLCLNQSDYQTAEDVNWRFTRYGERWNRDNSYERVAKVYRERGKLVHFVADFAARVEQDARSNPSLLDRVARGWEQVGYPEKALAIYDRQLEHSAFNLQAAQRKADLLLKLGRTEDALELLRHPKGITSLDAEVSAKLQLIRTLYQVDRSDESRHEIADLLAWDKRPSTLSQIATLLMEQRDYAKAADLLEQATASVRDWNYDELLIGLARCRAKLGKVEELNKTVEALSQSANADFRLRDLQAWLISERFLDLAAKVILSRLTGSPEDLDLHLALAASYADAGRTADVFAAFESAARAVPFDRQRDLQNRVASFLVERNLVADALKQRDAKDTPLLTGALINVFALADEKSSRAKLLADASANFNVADPESQVALADVLAKLNRPTDAAVWYRRALASTNEVARPAAASGLARTTGDKASVPVLSGLLQSKPQLFIGNDAYLAAVAKTGDTALIDQLSKLLSAAALHDSERDLFAMLLGYHRGLTNESRPKLAALVDAPKLTESQLQTIAKLCGEQGMNAERLKTLKRITQGGYSIGARYGAFSELVIAGANSGDLRGAVGALAEMQGVWGLEYCDAARAVLANSVTSDNFPTFKSAVLEVARSRPQDDVVSNLIGYCRQVAQRLGRDESAAKLAGEAQVSETERAESAAWDGLIEQWEISGPFRTQGGDSIVMPEATGSSKTVQPNLPPNLAWKHTDPRHELGIIRLGPLLGLSAAESAGQFAYARTTIVSPIERTVTFCLGSDDWVQAWVNGELVDSWMEGRPCYLDQDRFTVKLKKGENQVLIKVGNYNDAWGFCLRIAEDGMTAVAGNRR